MRTEDTCVDWVRRFVLFHAKRHSRDMGAMEIKVFLSHLAIVDKASASIQNPAKRALRLFIGRR
ncbi:MAG: phage integrase N-terminal SAM-like domain-containing protein [Pseudomonadota bacterium]